MFPWPGPSELSYLTAYSTLLVESIEHLVFPDSRRWVTMCNHGLLEGFSRQPAGEVE